MRWLPILIEVIRWSGPCGHLPQWSRGLRLRLNAPNRLRHWFRPSFTDGISAVRCRRLASSSEFEVRWGLRTTKFSPLDRRQTSVSPRISQDEIKDDGFRMTKSHTTSRGKLVEWMMIGLLFTSVSRYRICSLKALASEVDIIFDQLNGTLLRQ